MQMSIDSNISVLNQLGCTKSYMKDSTFPMTTQTCGQPSWCMTERFSGRWEPFYIKHDSYHSGIFGRKVSDKPMVAGSVSPLYTTTISSLPVSWWCYWPSSYTFCGYGEFTTDKHEPQLHWTCCGLKRWCPWWEYRWGREAGPGLEKLEHPRVAAHWIPPLSYMASDAVMPDLVDICPWNFYFTFYHNSFSVPRSSLREAII